MRKTKYQAKEIDMKTIEARAWELELKSKWHTRQRI